MAGVLAFEVHPCCQGVGGEEIELFDTVGKSLYITALKRFGSLTRGILYDCTYKTREPA